MNRLLVSFSGGRTSGYMTWRILQEWQDRYDEIVVLFANTGCEHEKTLEFVHNCDKHFGFNTVWVEADVVQERGIGNNFKIVDFDTASRDGKPFEESIAKYGIPNKAWPWCTDRLKMVPQRKYIRSIGWKAKTFDQCLGIRADEMDRMSIKADEHRIKYPLVSLGVTKQMVLDWWESQPFDLGLVEYLGNCQFCWKKSDRKLFTIAKYHPEVMHFPMKMEEKYGMAGALALTKNESQVFFRKHRSTKDIIASSKKSFTPWTPTTGQMQIGLFSLDEMDISNGCSESCEVEYI